MPGIGRQNLLSISRQSGAALTADRMVKVTTGGKVIAPATVDDIVIGVCRNTVTAADKTVTVQVQGVAIIETSAAVAAGVLVAVSGTDGRIATATPLDPTATQNYHSATGIALEASAGAGEKIAVLLTPSNIYVNQGTGI